MENLDINLAIIRLLPDEVQRDIWQQYWKNHVQLQLKQTVSTRIGDTASLIGRHMVIGRDNHNAHTYRRTRNDYNDKLQSIGVGDYICKPLINYISEYNPSRPANVPEYIQTLELTASTWYVGLPDMISFMDNSSINNQKIIENYKVGVDKYEKLSKEHGIKPIMTTRRQLVDRFYPPYDPELP